MFRCQICGQIAPAGTRANRVVLELRSKSYTSRGGQDGFQRRFRGGRVSRSDYDKGGKGHEIVQEVFACDSCANDVTPVVEPIPQVATSPVNADDAPAISESSAEIQPTKSE